MDSGWLVVAPGKVQRQTKPPWANISELLSTALGRSHAIPHGHWSRDVADDAVAWDISARCEHLQRPAWRYLRCRRELEVCVLERKQGSGLATLA